MIEAVSGEAEVEATEVVSEAVSGEAEVAETEEVSEEAEAVSTGISTRAPQMKYLVTQPKILLHLSQ